MSIFNDNKKNGFGSSSHSSSIIDHSSIHESKHSTSFHSDIHDHSKIHEAAHLGQDNIRNPFNHFPK